MFLRAPAKQAGVSMKGKQQETKQTENTGAEKHTSSMILILSDWRMKNTGM